ncbi:hypothetical protein MPER_12719 [Moniliophthora perniciosa FA553]|nr:hypothetical protein MPER_12719 [Moniliophthora perniciosa FA553]
MYDKTVRMKNYDPEIDSPITMANPPNQIRQILEQWNSRPAEVKTWPPGASNQYTIEHWLD